MREASTAELRCRRCADRFGEAIFLGVADYRPNTYDPVTDRESEEPTVWVTPYRRVGKKEMEWVAAGQDRQMRLYGRHQEDDPERRWVERDEVSSRDRKAVKLICRRCQAKPDVPFAWLLPPLEAGFREIHIRPGGEVYPVGVPQPG